MLKYLITKLQAEFELRIVGVYGSYHYKEVPKLFPQILIPLSGGGFATPFCKYYWQVKQKMKKVSVKFYTDVPQLTFEKHIF